MQDKNSVAQVLYSPLPDVPGAKASLITGVLSILLSGLGGVPGVICAIAALILAAKGKKYFTNNVQYTGASIKMLRAGRICGIIGLIIGLAASILWLFVLAIIIEGYSTAGSPFIYNLF